jgi:hypothetical protein
MSERDTFPRIITANDASLTPTRGRDPAHCLPLFLIYSGVSPRGKNPFLVSLLNYIVKTADSVLHAELTVLLHLLMS